MRYSQLFIPTLKEEPAEAETPSHKLLIRAGMLQKVASGIYSFLPLGWRVLKKVERIVREEMDKAGAQEMLMPALQPAKLWKRSGRWEEYGPEMMRLKDRNKRDFCLGPTHEELITDIVMGKARSYKQLPLNLYQIQVKFRDEIRPRFGPMRAREFLMKDAYSFDADKEGLKKSYEQMFSAYGRIIERCGLKYRAVEAATGIIGGKVSQEFMVLADTGEDTIIYCSSCSYAANQEKAASGRRAEKSSETPQKRKVVKTPGQESVEEVSKFLRIPGDQIVKTLVYQVDQKKLVAVLIRGDREANESKIAEFLKTEDLSLLPERSFSKHKLVPGFVGPVGLKKIKIIADEDLLGMTNFVTGANKKDTHFVSVNQGIDFKVDGWADLKVARAGDKCPYCQGILEQAQGIEVGHVFQLGTKYSEVMKAKFIDQDGQEKPYVMGCYGIGVSRLMAAAIEQYHDEAGIIWPFSLAPYHVVVIGLNWAATLQRRLAEKLYRELEERNIEVMLDDRAETAGTKFADADLIGFPIQAIVGTKAETTSQVEIKLRASSERKEISLEGAAREITSMVRRGLAELSS